MNDWTELKKSFTQEQENAIWQYFIDHSKLQPNGFLGIMFYVRDVDDFWKRIWFRYTGEYARYDKLEKADRQEKVGWAMAKKDARKKAEVIKKIDLGRNWWKKLILFIYRKSRDNLFKEYGR